MIGPLHSLPLNLKNHRLHLFEEPETLIFPWKATLIAVSECSLLNEQSWTETSERIQYVTVQYITFKSTINNYWIRFSYDSKNHHGRGLCYLPKPKPEADNTNQCLDNSCYRKMNPSIVLLCIPLSVSKEILMSLLRATILSEGMTSPVHVKELVSDHRSYTNSLSSCKI